MPDALTTISHLINSPPGQLAAGGVLAGIVWKFFERVESVLNDNTKLEIAAWLLGVKVGKKVEAWPDTFANIFDRVFGARHLSWRCFWRSCTASVASVCIVLCLMCTKMPLADDAAILKLVLFSGLQSVAPLLVVNCVPDYLSLLETRFMLNLMRSHATTIFRALLVLIDFSITLIIAVVAASFATLIRYSGIVIQAVLQSNAPHKLEIIRLVLPALGRQFLTTRWIAFNIVVLAPLSITPAFFTSIWLWLYAGSGFLLKAARRFDIGFEWFNRHFDIEKKPLQSIGLVAGALVAVVYWAAVIVSRVVG